MTEFNPTEAARDYAEKSDEELACIAHKNSEYLPEAKALAVRELEKRGVADDRDVLIAQARIRAKKNRKAAKIADAVTHERANEFMLKIGGALVIGVLWIFALMGPAVVTTFERPSDGVLLLIAWAATALYAIRKARQGKPRLLYLVVVVPAILFGIGMAFRWMT